MNPTVDHHPGRSVAAQGVSGTLTNGAGGRAEFTRAGALRRFELRGLSVLQYPAGDLEDGPAGLYLRHRVDGVVVAVTPLLGQRSNATLEWTDRGPVVRTSVGGVDATVAFRLADSADGAESADRADSWFWHLRLRNTTDLPLTLDVLHAQDVALAPYHAVRNNEYYVSQYLDLTPVPVAGHGVAVAVRQNMPGDRHPWALIGCLGECAGWATDSLQLTGRRRLDGEPLPGLAADLPSRRLQHEHTMAALQTAPLLLRPRGIITTGFFGTMVADHPAATSDADARIALRALADPAAAAPSWSDGPADPERVVPSLFAAAPMRTGLDIPAPAPSPGALHRERENSIDVAWFTPRGDHVVTAAKQRSALRPHGQLIRTGSALTPDERALTSTAWMAGTFLSQVTQGHVSLGSALSLRRGYLGLQQAHGVRIFVAPQHDPQTWSLLGVPSRWIQAPDSCRWQYRGDDGNVEVEVLAPADAHELRLSVTAEEPLRLLVAAHFTFGGDDGAAPGSLARQEDPSGVTITAPTGWVRLGWQDGSVEQIGDDRLLMADDRSVGAPWLTVIVPPTTGWAVTVTADLLGARQAPAAEVPDEELTATPSSDSADAVRIEPAGDAPEAAELRRIGAILPWFTHDAMIHYLSPRGLEQYAGGGWGTRDICQGPVGLLLALGHHRALRDVVVRLMKAQNARGDWPQAFEFYPRYRRYHQQDAHGDVIYWPILAAAEYLSATADAGLLAERLPFVGDGSATEPASVREHLIRALGVIDASRIPGTDLPAYSHGDWNDSLQPADKALAAGMCSTWTVVLQAHALSTLASALEAVGDNELAARARRTAGKGTAAMCQLLIKDGVIAGYGLFDTTAANEKAQSVGGCTDPTDGSAALAPSALLVHPGDLRTGLRYSLLPMIHAISGDLLSREQALHHLELIKSYLTGPDGARLFDRPARYQGGPMEVFQRAEASTFFGREIGIMYVHAHLRYAEALARFGDAAGFLRALALANPIGVTERIPSARPRQSTTYFSSSDAAFADRYAAADGYSGVIDGSVPLEGGWRVYSSGPGLYLRLVVENLLGIRQRGGTVEIDPVLPPALDGLSAVVPLAGRSVRVRYRVGPTGSGVRSAELNNFPLGGNPLHNPYRAGGLGVSSVEVLAALTDGDNTLMVDLG